MVSFTHAYALLACMWTLAAAGPSSESFTPFECCNTTKQGSRYPLPSVSYTSIVKSASLNGTVSYSAHATLKVPQGGTVLYDAVIIEFVAPISKSLCYGKENCYNYTQNGASSVILDNIQPIPNENGKFSVGPTVLYVEWESQNGTALNRQFIATCESMNSTTPAMEFIGPSYCWNEGNNNGTAVNSNNSTGWPTTGFPIYPNSTTMATATAMPTGNVTSTGTPPPQLGGGSRQIIFAKSALSIVLAVAVILIQ